MLVMVSLHYKDRSRAETVFGLLDATLYGLTARVGTKDGGGGGHGPGGGTHVSRLVNVRPPVATTVIVW